MRRYARGAVALVGAAAMAASACGGDDDNDRADYVTALSGTGDTEFTEEEGRCFAEALVDAVGVEALEEADVLGQLEENPNADPSQLGLDLDEAQGSAFFGDANECVDLRVFFEETLASEGGLTPELASCVMEQIDDATFERLMVVSFTEGDAGLNADPELSATFEQAGAQCAAAGTT
jgi:hypothetical protein